MDGSQAMPEEISQQDIDNAIKILKEDANLEHNTKLMERLDRIEERLNRTPTKELSAEEKAAEYDLLMSERQGKTDPPPSSSSFLDDEWDDDTKNKIREKLGQPPAPKEKEETAPPPSKKSMWDKYQ